VALGGAAGASAVFPHAGEVGATGAAAAVVENFHFDAAAIPAFDFGVGVAFAAFAVQGFSTDDVGHGLRFF
jgi:ATP phosphoribosyltransferase regulatory subunit HisZ